MADPTITNVDTGSLVLQDGEFRDELLTFAGADTFAAGTILARSTATGKLVLYAIGGVTAGNGIPKAVLTYEVSAAGAGDVKVRACIAGVVNKSRLVVDADGDDSNLTGAILDELRDFGIVALEVAQLSALDNA